MCLIYTAWSNKIKSSLHEPILYPVSIALTQMINSGKLYSLTTSPSIARLSIFESTKNHDFIKSHECSEPSSDTGRPTPQGSNMSLFVFIIIVIVVVFIFYFLIKMIGKTNYDYTQQQSRFAYSEYQPIPERSIIGESS